MAVERPAILITPLDDSQSDETLKALGVAIFGAQPGQVITAAFPVNIYHLIDGLWIESSDLSEILVKNESDIPKEEGEPWQRLETR